MRLGRKPKEVDWQAELAASSAAHAGAQAPAAVRGGAGWSRRFPTIFWGLVRPAVALVATAGLVIGRHHLAGVVLGVLWVCLWPLDALAARRRKREREAAESPTIEQQIQWELRAISRELRWIIDSPPERSIYEAWINGATQKLQRFSPEVAERWGRPDLGRRCSGSQVSDAELSARRGRMLELYAEFAPPDNVELVSSELPHAPSARAITSS
jgi:hypothetical protein